MSAEIRADFSQFPAIQHRLDKLAGAFTGELLQGIGGVLEAGARRRIQSTQASPAGVPWAPWSEGYRASRGPQHRLLESSGGLRDSIGFEVHGDDQVIVYAAKEYAASHQFGDDRQVKVAAHQRTVTQAFGKKLASPATADVKAHSVKRNLPARPFLGIGDDEAAEIESLIDGLASEALR